MLHEAFGADDSLAQAGPGDIAAVKDFAQVWNSRPCIADAHEEHLRLSVAHPKLYKSALGVAEGVARQFRRCGRQPNLFLVLKAQQGSEVAGPLPRLDHMALMAKPDGQRRKSEGFRHCL